jgi:hypothetical protein
VSNGRWWRRRRRSGCDGGGNGGDCGRGDGAHVWKETSATPVTMGVRDLWMRAEMERLVSEARRQEEMGRRGTTNDGAAGREIRGGSHAV